MFTRSRSNVRQRSSAFEGVIAATQSSSVSRRGLLTSPVLSTASDLLVHVAAVLQAMDGAAQDAAVLCACKAAFQLLLLPSLAASNSVVSFCCCCLLLFTDLLVAGECQGVNDRYLATVLLTDSGVVLSDRLSVWWDHPLLAQLHLAADFYCSSLCSPSFPLSPSLLSNVAFEPF